MTISDRLKRLSTMPIMDYLEAREIAREALSELGRLQLENSQLREEGAALLDANHNLSAEIDRLKRKKSGLEEDFSDLDLSTKNFLMKEVKALSSRLGKERADGLERLEEIGRLKDEIGRLKARTVPGWKD